MHAQDDRWSVGYLDWDGNALSPARQDLTNLPSTTGFNKIGIVCKLFSLANLLLKML